MGGPLHRRGSSRGHLTYAFHPNLGGGMTLGRPVLQSSPKMVECPHASTLIAQRACKIGATRKPPHTIGRLPCLLRGHCTSTEQFFESTLASASVGRNGLRILRKRAASSVETCMCLHPFTSASPLSQRVRATLGQKPAHTMPLRPCSETDIPLSGAREWATLGHISRPAKPISKQHRCTAKI